MKKWAIIGVLGFGGVVVSTCLACLILGMLFSPSRSTSPSVEEVTTTATSTTVAKETPTLKPTSTSTQTATVTVTPTSKSSPTNVLKATLTSTRPPTTRPPAPTATRKPAANCSPSYPDVCIPPPPPDLNCKDIPYRKFRVLPPDPHGFDRDGNGIGCED